MENIVFLGKGGIGKSTIASNVSVLLAARGSKVLHVGCDPKMDSSLSLMGREIVSFTSRSFTGEASLRASIHASPIKNISCIEAGGPHPGLGCAGTGIGAMLDAIRDAALLEKGVYDAAVFDVLGDVVCGGFAAPLRRGFARKAVIVVSEEILSLYAANKLIAMLNNYARNGVYLAGLAVNAKDGGDLGPVLSFAKAVNTRILGVIPRSREVAQAERAQKPVLITAPKSAASLALCRLGLAIAGSRAPRSGPVTIGDPRFFSPAGTGAAPRPAPARPAAGKGAPRDPRGLVEAAGFRPAAIIGGQVSCALALPSGVLKVFVMRAANCPEGMPRVNDWGVGTDPEEGAVGGKTRGELERLLASRAAAALNFDDFMAAFCGGVDFYGYVMAHYPAGSRLPNKPHTAFGQWYRFVFSDSENVFIPPGVMMVEHADPECRFTECSNTPLNMFTKSAGLSAVKGQALTPFLPREEACIVNTGLRTADAACGDAKRLEAALDFAASRTIEDGLVELYLGCTALALGGDVRAVAEAAAERNRVEIPVVNYNSFSSLTPSKMKARVRFVARKLGLCGRREALADVNLVDFGDAGRTLGALLSENGVRVLPRSGDLYRDVASARMQVLHGYSASGSQPEAPVRNQPLGLKFRYRPDPVWAGAFDRRGIKWVAPPPPYGFAATTVWLSSVAAGLGRSGRRPRPPRRLEEARRALSAKCAGYTAGFAVSCGEMDMLDGSGMVSGIPLLSFLSEAGFGLRLMVYAPDAGDERAAEGNFRRLRAAFGPARAQMAFYRTPRQLSAAIAGDKRMRMVYSDIPGDGRITSLGKNVFTASVFEAGYEGALETMTRLLEICEWKFNERYRPGL